MRDWILLAVALAVAPAGAARAQMAGAPDGGAPPQVIMVSPPPAAGDGGGGPVVIVTEGDGGTPVATGPGEPDAGPGEEVLLLVPAKKP
ncbi:MAG TPA: hypothetical protein VND93_16200, partial [Myxococcales bacterium]|nr:hypothetical protein [Myxococcales bacterium]